MFFGGLSCSEVGSVQRRTAKCRFLCLVYKRWGKIGHARMVGRGVVYKRDSIVVLQAFPKQIPCPNAMTNWGLAM